MLILIDLFDFKPWEILNFSLTQLGILLFTITVPLL